MFKVLSLRRRSLGASETAAPHIRTFARDAPILKTRTKIGILYAAPTADLIAMIVAAALTVKFMKSLKETPHEKSDEVLKPSKPGVIITIARRITKTFLKTPGKPVKITSF